MKKILALTLAVCLFISYGGIGYAAGSIAENTGVVEYIEIEKELVELEYNNIDDSQIQPMFVPVLPLVLPAIAAVALLITQEGVKKAATYFTPVVVRYMIRTAPSVAKAAAENLGYTLVKDQYSHGAKIFKAGKKAKGPAFISVDQDAHSGGAWKGASSIKNLGHKDTRSGTYDEELTRMGD